MAQKGDEPAQQDSEPINRFYDLQSTSDQRAKEDWIAKAQTSPCAQKIDELLKDENSNKVKALKQEMFDRIYETMPDEVVPEEMKMALVVKNLKFRWITSCFLTVFTLGFFLLVRPKDDDAVLVMTGTNRVIMLKRARQDFFGSTGAALLLTVSRYLLVLLVLVSLPSLIGGLLANGGSGSQSVSLALLNVELNLDEEFATLMHEKKALVIVVMVLFFLYVLFYLWTKIPYDYGTRYRRSHAGAALTCAQLSFRGSNARRQGMMRLYFGRYPLQSTLDQGMNVVASSCAGPVQADGFDMNGKYRPGGQKAFITALAGILTVVTLVDAGFTWYDRSLAAAAVVGTSTFCEEATKNGTAFCSRARCAVWAHDNSMDSSFCDAVGWYAKAESGSTGRRLEGGAEDAEAKEMLGMDFFGGSVLEGEALCRAYASGAPCCAGCRKGKFLGYLSNTLNIVKETSAILTDLTAICVSLAAAQHVLSQAVVTDHIEVPFTKSPSATHPISTFALTRPLALYFFGLVFTIAFPDREDKAAGMKLRRQKKDDDLSGHTHGVKNYDIEEESQTFDDFFRKNSLAAPGSSHYFPKVIVPKAALGIKGHEEIYGAWLESPRLTLVSMIPVFVLSVVVLLLVSFWPNDWHPIILPGLEEDNVVSKILTGIVLGIVALVLGTLLYYIFIIRSVQHACVVTNERVFYIRYRTQCICCCRWGSDIRVDVWRHDHDVFFGNMETMAPSIIQRYMRFEWLPGDIYMQCIWGIVHFRRRFGNAVDVFHCVSQLSKMPDYMTMEELESHGVDVNLCRDSIEDLNRKHDVVWEIRRQQDDVARADPLLYLRDKEQPLYHWSTKEIGPVSSPFHINNDVIITSGRVFLWSRAIYKPFDCKTCCCFGACWCTCFKKIFQASRLETSMSFISLPLLLSFSTDLNVDPPIWYDPNATPVKVPCCEKCCRCCTLCTTCDCSGAREVFHDEDCFRIRPRRRGPRTRLGMMWRARYGPIIACTVKPYAAPECDNKDLEAVGIFNNNHAAMMEALDKVMNVAQAKHEGR